jgi:two-component system response regulator LytT
MKLKVLIIEDEEPAAERLKKMITQLDPEIEIQKVIVSIKSAVEYLKENIAPDLIFLDIHLADGSSFEIFNQVHVNSPIIFTTAYDEFALNAFKLKSVDYLLKPIKSTELSSALNKYSDMFGKSQNGSMDYQKLIDLIPKEKPEFKKRLLVRYGDLFKMIPMEDASYFYTENKTSYVCTKQNMKYAIDNTLDEMEKMLEPKEFFRINRQFIVSIGSIEKMVAVSKSRVKLFLKPPTEHDTIASTDRSSNFKKWLGEE